jgi:hypothetical protein
MIRYRVTYKDVEELFGYNVNQTKVLEFDDYISRKEIAKQLNIDIDSIVNIEVL